MMSGDEASRILAQATLENKIVEIGQATPAVQAARTWEMVDLKFELNTMSPFNAMFPADVVCEIFKLVKETQDTSDFSSLPIPFVLGSVCKAWRQTVQSDTQLWDTIIIRLSPSRFALQEQLLKDWLIRSGQYWPLHCYITFTNGDSKWKPPVSFAKLILETSRRWRVFECFPNIPSLSQELQKPGLDFSSLTKLKIYHSPCFKLDFLNAARLQHLIIIGQNYKIFQVTLLVNWGQLTTLEILTDTELSVALGIVPTLVAIQSLSLRLLVTNEGVFSTRRQAARKLLHLSSLTLHTSTHPRSIPAVLDAITSPALTQLVLSFGDPGHTFTTLPGAFDSLDFDLFGTFYNFFHRSPCFLERCTISFSLLWRGMRLDAMRKIATLTQLLYHSVTENDDIVFYMAKEHLKLFSMMVSSKKQLIVRFNIRSDAPRSIDR